MSVSTHHRRSALGQRSLERKFYVDPALFDRELEWIFARAWIMLGREQDCRKPRTARATTVGGQPIVIVRGDDGQLRGFHNVCRHRGATVANEGIACLEKPTLTCPYHAWSYDLAGNLVGAPNMMCVENFERDRYGLKPIHVKLSDGFVWVSLAGQPGDAASYFEPLTVHLRSSGAEGLINTQTIEYEVRANWKLLFENYSECYHCPTVHPALNRLTPYKGASNEVLEGPILGGPMSLAEGVETMSTSGKYCGRALPGLSDDQRRSVYYFTVFPSCFLSFHPDYLLVHRIEPLAVDRTRVACEFLFHPDAAARANFDPRDAVEFWDLTNRQDWEVCERVQQGARSSAFAPGPLSDLESVVAAFDRHYLSVMGDE
jgi:Rieske 2Fe-2S family protein